MFVFRQQYMLLGPFPMGLLQTHMEVICSKFFSRERSKREENGLGILGLEISWRGWDKVGVYVFGGYWGLGVSVRNGLLKSYK